MSKTQTPNNNALVAYDPARFAVAMPNNAPALGFDITAEFFNWRDVMPRNFWNMQELNERRQVLGGWPVFTPERIVIKPVYDGSKYENKEVPQAELAPHLVMEFEESVPGLVLNKSRCEMLTQMTGTPDPRRWIERLGTVALEVGVFNSKAQIIVVPVTRPTVPPRQDTRPDTNLANQTVEELNRDLFG